MPGSASRWRWCWRGAAVWWLPECDRRNAGVTKVEVTGFLHANVLQQEPVVERMPGESLRGWRREFLLIGATKARQDGASLGIVVSSVPTARWKGSPRLTNVVFAEEHGAGPQFVVVVRHVRVAEGEALTPETLVGKGWLRWEFAEGLREHPSPTVWRGEVGGMGVRLGTTKGGTAVMTFSGTADAGGGTRR